ncbi:MAG: ROK family protein, partial [Chloroflexota bacterium]
FPNPDNYLAFDTLQPEIEALVQSAIDVHAAHNCDLLGIGIGLTGLVNVDEGISIHSPNLGWRNLPIRDIFEDRFKLPVFVGNGAALAALSERHYGLSQDVQNSIYVATSHTGVGSGIFINNQLFHGVRGYAGEIGHMVVNPAGTRCGCGRIGCWETEIGERHIAQRLIARIAAGEKSILADQTDITLRGILNAAAQDDALAIETIDTLCRMLGLGLANLVNIFNPDMIVLGGIFRDLPQPCIARVQQIVESEAMGVASSGIQIIRGALPMEDACVLGAAALVLDDVLRVPTFHAIR